MVEPLQASTNSDSTITDSDSAQGSKLFYTISDSGESLKKSDICIRNRNNFCSGNVSDSKSSSKLIFPSISCIPQDSLFLCFILSVWDNIVGPQTAYVWKKKKRLTSENTFPKNENKNIIIDRKSSALSTNLLDNLHTTIKLDLKDEKKLNINFQELKTPKLNLQSIISYVTEHAVGVGESSIVQSKKIVSLMLIASSQNIILLSVKFSIIEDGVVLPYCLSAVIPIENEPHLLPVVDLCSDFLLRTAVEARLLISKEGLENGVKIQKSLLELSYTISSLRDASLDHYPIEDLSFQPDDRRMAERMLTSHLQTMGTTLVIANSPSEGNKVVMWLAQFLNKEELPLSRIALSDFQWPYQPGITIQAVIRDSSGAVDLSSSKLLCSKRPLTLIDLTSGTVRQMAPIHIHSKNSVTAFRQRLMALWHDLDNIPAPSQSLFEPVQTISPLVKRFLHEWDRLGSCDPTVRKSFLNSFLRSLQYYALAIILWTSNEWTVERRRREQKTLPQVISSTFLLEESDLKVVLAQAEMIQPGFTSVIYE